MLDGVRRYERWLYVAATVNYLFDHVDNFENSSTDCDDFWDDDVGWSKVFYIPKKIEDVTHMIAAAPKMC